MKAKYFNVVVERCSHQIVKSFYYFSILVVLAGVSSADTWIPFTNVEKGYVSEANTLPSYTDAHFDRSGANTQWNITVNFPGAIKSNPDDNGLLAGKYNELWFHSKNRKLMGYRINGTLRPEKLGTPNLPYVRLQVQLPSSIKSDAQFDIKVVDEQFHPVEGIFDIAPVQQQLFESFVPGVHKDNRVFQIDKEIFNKSDYFTHGLEYELFSIHGLKVVDIKYCPLKYNPVTKKLLATGNARIVITYKSSESNVSTSYRFSQIVRNASFNGVNNRRELSYLNKKRGGKLVVVGHPDLTELQVYKDYLDWRTGQGYELIETIDASTTSTSEITSQLKSLYSSNKFEYLIIVGDDTKIDSPFGGSSDEDYHYKDWCRLDGDDTMSDVFMGIFLADGEERLTNIINHQKLQEEGGEWNKTIIMGWGLELKNGVAGRFSSSHYSVRNCDKPDGGLGFTVNRVYKGSQVDDYGGSNSFCNIPQTPFEEWTLTPNPFFSNSSDASDKVAEYWNQGAALVGHRDHGSKTGPSSPKMTGSWMNSEIKHECSPLMTSLNCSSGNFKYSHTSNFTYQSQGNEFGSCATISAPVTTSSGDNDYFHLAMYKSMFPMDGTDPFINVGQIFLAGLEAGKKHSRTYFHIFGDPMTNLSLGGNNQKFIELVFPNGGDKLEVGRTFYITWRDNIDDSVKIELLKGGTVKKVLSESAPSTAPFEWKIPDDFEKGTDYNLRFTSVMLDTINDECDSTFTIEEQHNLELKTPNGGEYIEKDTEVEITWEDDFDGDIKLDLFKNDIFYKVIVESAPSNGTYTWKVPDDVVSGDDYQVTISGIEKVWFVDTSDDYFSIQNPAVTEFPYVQDFDEFEEGGVVFRAYWEQLEDDDLEWTVWTGMTPTKVPDQGAATGPDNDHTSGSGNYLYVESSAPNNPDKKAHFISPLFNLGGLKEGTCSFWYHMFSDNEGNDEMGDFYIDVGVDGTWEEGVLTFSGDKGDEWHETSIDLKDYVSKMAQFRFRAVTGSGWASDICIDDFEIKGVVNKLPIFTSTFDTSAMVGTEYVYKVEAKDDDGDPLTIKGTTVPSWLTLTDNGDETAELKGTPAEDNIGANEVVLGVNDGFLSNPVVQDFIVIVEKQVGIIHEIGDFSHNSRLSAIPNPTDRDNNRIFFHVDASDIQKGELNVYDAVGNTVFNTVIIPGGKKEITWNLKAAKTGSKVHSGAYLAIFIFVDNDGSAKMMNLNIGVK